ncbi:MAG: chitobiase/beta-hexosaminidase C-terminal domain-containing protein, partial [Clostridia bacterium]|nr:chitobiase/beta-hexosaminidase C-terminal domain-containing protein [Clostridia bacterium]
MNLKKVCAILLLLSLALSVFPPISISSEVTQVELSDFRGLVISRVFGHGDKKDAVTAYSFFELYNASENTLDLDGLALYYKTSGSDPYVSFEFGDQQNHVMAPGSFYLIRCNQKSSSAEVITLTHWDAIWNLSVSNKEIKLILAEEGRTIDPLVQPAEVADVLSYFCATDDYYFDAGYLIGEMSKSKYAVRTALREDSGWTDVSLTKQNAAGLRRIMPQYSGGDAGEIVASNYAEVTFSRDAGIYTDGFALSMTPPSGYASVYYTLDGSDPRTSASRVLYSTPLNLNDTSSKGPGETTTYVANAMTSKDNRAPGDYLPLSNDYPGGYVVKAVAFDGENYTDVYTNTYFISSLFEDYGVTVMSLSMDKEDVAGTSATAFYNHYITDTNESNPRSQGILEVFDENGSRRGYSNIEIAVNGHASANYAMKSMKLYFKKALNQDENGDQIGGLENKLNYDLFDGRATNCKGQAITTFSRLVLRNSG